MPTHKTDAQIQRDVIEELAWDTRVDEAEIGVHVHHGVVTITGAVPSWAKRLAARDAAHRVAGVRDVADELQVQPHTASRPSDAAIAEAVRHALQWHALVPEDQIRTTVSDGVVTLTGTVDLASQREDAARAVEHLFSVHAVINDIKVNAPSITPTLLRVAIEGALDRHAAREAKRVKLDIDGSNVIVSGEVDSLGERLAVIGAIIGTRGVETVIDQTRIG